MFNWIKKLFINPQDKVGHIQDTRASEVGQAAVSAAITPAQVVKAVEAAIEVTPVPPVKKPRKTTKKPAAKKPAVKKAPARKPKVK